MVRDLLMIFLKHGLIMSHMEFEIFTRIALRLLDFFFFFSGITMNKCEEKRIRSVYMSQVIKMIDIISHNRFSNISSYVNKVVIKHISYVPRIRMDNIILNYLLYSIFYLAFFCVNCVINDAPSLFYIVFWCIYFMFIIILFWSSNLSCDEISEMSIKIFRNFILTVEWKIMLSFFFWRTKILEVLFWYVPCSIYHMISIDE